MQATSAAPPLKGEHTLLLPALLLISGLAWLYLLSLGAGSDQGLLHPGHSALGHVHVVSHATSSAGSSAGHDFGLTFGMWAAMMVAMMVPPTLPVILAYARTERERSGRARALRASARFVLGYLTVWIGYSLLATLAQWGLDRAALLSSMMGRVDPVLGGAILLAVGLFQLTPMKHSYLRHCRQPSGSLLGTGQARHSGAFALGLLHGVHCTVSCGALMTLMFVAGVMNVAWMALITALIVIEKTLPAGDWVGRAAGVLLSGLGLCLLGDVL